MNQIFLGIAAVLLLTGVARPAELREIRLDTHQFEFSPEIVIDAKDGSVRLARSVLFADEMGTTDFRQTETLSDHIWAKKVFDLRAVPDQKAAARAELFIFGSPREVRFNGEVLPKVERLNSTGWTRIGVPSALLVTKDEETKLVESRKRSDRDEYSDPLWLNRVMVRGSGSLLVEPSRKPGTSFKSTDGGRTWSNEILGANGVSYGEYLIRLRLDNQATHGSLVSPVFDLWSCGPNAPATSGSIERFQPLPEVSTLHGIYGDLRTGSTPTPDDKTWTSWQETSRYRAFVPKPEASGHRWGQVRYRFRKSGPRLRTLPLPRSLNFSYDLRPDADAPKEPVEITPETKVIARTSVPFVYQAPSPRLKLLRERYKLDEVIAPGKTEMEQLMLLRHWVRNQWHTAWSGGAASWMPPWDAHIILDCKDQTDCLTMCTHYAAVFTQCCLALGWTARHCILDHHCVSEVFVNQHNKWVMMDAGNSKERADVGLHFERGGVPLSALDLHLVYHQKKPEGITVHFTPKALAEKISSLCRPEPMEPARSAKKQKKVVERGPRPDAIPLAELTQYPVCQLNNYRRYAFPARNNYLDSLLPGELYQGWSEYFYDGYWWVGDSPDNPQLSPEYSKHLDPARSQDIDWSLNWTRIHLARTAKAGELQVDLETLTPNFARFEMFADGKWKPTPARFNWTLTMGKNELRVRSVNQFERPGIEASVQVKRGD